MNSSGRYYNDICYTAKSDSGADIILKDRKNNFISKNMAVCQDDCIFTEYDKNTKKVKCSCKIKEPSSSTADMNINIDKLLKNFIDIQNIANIGLLVCYKKLLSLKHAIKNIGFLILIPIVILHFICIILFYCKQLKRIKKIIIDIIFAKNVLFLFHKKEKSKHKKNLSEFLFKGVKNYLTTSQAQKEEIDSLKKNYSTSLILLENNINISKKEKNNRKKNNKRKYNLNNIIYSKQKINKKLDFENDEHQLKTIVKKIFKQKSGESINKGTIIKKANEIKKIIEFNEQELNDLNYKLALIYDKRQYCEYYSSLIKTKHKLIFSFYYNKDYNSRIIKIDLFFFGFVTDFAVNALFFNDDTMHKIYEEKGKFQFLYQLPQILYSCLISSVFNIPLNILALSEDDLLKLKKDKSNVNLEQKQKDLFKKLQIKFLLFFIISTIFVLFLWYYISMFCSVYVNTQMHLIQDTLISFGLSVVYPFGIYLLPGIFRIPSLADRKKRKIYFYIISKVLQTF